MLDAYEALCDSFGHRRDSASLEKAWEIVTKLSGILPGTKSITDEGFLNKNFRVPRTSKNCHWSLPYRKLSKID